MELSEAAIRAEMHSINNRYQHTPWKHLVGYMCSNPGGNVLNYTERVRLLRPVTNRALADCKSMLNLHSTPSPAQTEDGESEGLGYGGRPKFRAGRRERQRRDWPSILNEVAAGLDADAGYEEVLEGVVASIGMPNRRIKEAERQMRRFIQMRDAKARAEMVLADPGFWHDAPLADWDAHVFLVTFDQAHARMRSLRGEGEEGVAGMDGLERRMLHECVVAKVQALRVRIVEEYMEEEGDELSWFEVAQSLFREVGRTFTPVAKAVLMRVGYGEGLGSEWQEDLGEDWEEKIAEYRSQEVASDVQYMACLLFMHFNQVPVGQIAHHMRKVTLAL